MRAIPRRGNSGDRSSLQKGAQNPVEMFGREVLAGSPREQAAWVDRALGYWRERGFPYPSLTEEEAEREFRRVQAVTLADVIQKNEVRPSTVGLRLANTFHPQIWSVPARQHRRAPVDHFSDDRTLRKLLERAARFWPDRRCWNGQCLRGMLRIYAGGRVSNFRPAAARAIMLRYSSAGETVLDFSAGFGGRLLACLTLDRHYIGIEPAKAQMAGLRRMVETLGRFTPTATTLFEGCAEEVMPQLEPDSVDLVFSSPPYFNIERYCSEQTQSFQRYKTYQMWKERFLMPVLKGSHRMLRRGGHLVVNIADTVNHTIAQDLEEAGRPLFRQEKLLRLLMHSRPLQRAAGIRPFRWEPVLVFTKVDR